MKLFPIQKIKIIITEPNYSLYLLSIYKIFSQKNF